MGQIIGKEYKSDAELQADARFWQGLLRLGNWDITSRLAQPQDMTPDAFGNCEWWINTLRAKIQILASGFNHGDHDQENTLAHEHVHLVLTPMAWVFRKALDELAPSARGPLQEVFDNYLEQAVNVLGEALVQLKRRAAANQTPEVTSGGSPEAS